MSTCDISKYEWSISIFEHFMTKFHELPEQPSYNVHNKQGTSKKCYFVRKTTNKLSFYG